MPNREPGFGEFRYKDSDQGYFTNGSATERLAATLNSRLTDEPSPQQVRMAAADKAKADVDAKWPQDEMVSAAKAVFAAGATQAAEVARQKADMKPEAFLRWKGEADERFAEYLLTATKSFAAIVDRARNKAPKVARPFPVTSPDIAALAIRLNALDVATPVEAKALVDDGIAREDSAFLVQAAANLRSWLAYRNSWQAADAKAIGGQILESIDGQAWTPEADAAEYAAESC